MFVGWIGILMFSYAFIYLRKPGKRLWVFVPIWKWSEYLTPVGVKLAYFGLVVGFLDFFII
jgi:hypothetical protein